MVIYLVQNKLLSNILKTLIVPLHTKYDFKQSSDYL